MKKFISIVLIFIMGFTFSSCKKKENKENDNIITDPFEGLESITITNTYQERRERFFDEMYILSQKIGCTFSRDAINSPIGLSNYSVSLEDMLHITVAAVNNPICLKYMQTESYETNVIDMFEDTRNISINNTVTKGTYSHYLTDYYEVIGGKTGSLVANEKRPGTFTLGIAVKAPDGGMFVLYESKEGTSSEEDNLFTRAKIIFDIANRRLNDKNADITDLKNQLTCDCYAVIHLPKDFDYLSNMDYDWLGNDSIYLIDYLNKDKKIITASTWKMMTTITATQFIYDYSDIISVYSDDITLAEEDIIEVEDKLSYDDLFYFIYLKSSNSSNNCLAYNIGTNLLKYDKYCELNGISNNIKYVYNYCK